MPKGYEDLKGVYNKDLFLHSRDQNWPTYVRVLRYTNVNNMSG